MLKASAEQTLPHLEGEQNESRGCFAVRRETHACERTLSHLALHDTRLTFSVSVKPLCKRVTLSATAFQPAVTDAVTVTSVTCR